METTRKGSRQTRPLSVTAAVAVLLGAAVTAAGLLLFAALIAGANLDRSTASPLASVAAGLGAFAAGWYLSAKMGSRGLLHGLLAGGLLFAILTLLSLVFDPSGFGLLTLLHAVILLLASSVGGICGVNVRPSRRIR